MRMRTIESKLKNLRLPKEVIQKIYKQMKGFSDNSIRHGSENTYWIRTLNSQILAYINSSKVNKESQY